MTHNTARRQLEDSVWAIEIPHSPYADRTRELIVEALHAEGYRKHPEPETSRDDEREALIADARQEAGKWGPGPTATGSLLRRLADALEDRKHPEPEWEYGWEARFVDGDQVFDSLEFGSREQAENAIAWKTSEEDSEPEDTRVIYALVKRVPAIPPGPWVPVGEGEQ